MNSINFNGYSLQTSNDDLYNEKDLDTVAQRYFTADCTLVVYVECERDVRKEPKAARTVHPQKYTILAPNSSDRVQYRVYCRAILLYIDLERVSYNTRFTR